MTAQEVWLPTEDELKDIWFKDIMWDLYLNIGFLRIKFDKTFYMFAGHDIYWLEVGFNIYPKSKQQVLDLIDMLNPNN